MTSPAIPRLAIIGAGRLATARIYPNIGAAGASLVGACDLDAERAAGNCARWGGKPYTDWRAMVDEQRPDGVIVCINGRIHAEIAPELLRRRIPVYTEKPPAMDAEAAEGIARAAAETGTPYQCAFKKRYAAGTVRAKEWLRAHQGAAWLAYGATYASGSYPNTDQLRDFLFDFAIHHIDLALHLMGPVARVHAWHEQRSAWAVSLRFASGALGTLHLNCGRSFGAPTETIELTAAGGNALRIENSSSWRILERGRASEWREPLTFISAGDSGRDTGHLAELEAFVRVVRGEREANQSGAAEAAATMRLFEAIERSAADGTVVELAAPATAAAAAG
jgi:predicted dehydrogenase